MQARPVRRFREDEARSKLGTVVHTRAAFWKVPYGTRGRVVEIYQVAPGWFDVVIEWDLRDPSSTQRDRFAKEPFDEFLAEVSPITPPITNRVALA
jgi:hypothetical protein